MRANFWAIAAVSLLLVGGCRCKQPVEVHEAPIPRGEAPTYPQVAASYNTRVDPLVRLWCRTVVRLQFVDAEGKTQREQVEGFLQYVRPSKALVTFHKVGRVLALLGSDGNRYWWIELGEVKRAFVGRHEQATPDRIGSAGLRVHPLDLMELMGLTPLPVTMPEATIAWSSDGRWIVVTIPGRIGQRRLHLNPDTYEPGRVEIVGERGRILAKAELSGFERVGLKGGKPDAPRSRVPTYVEVEADEGVTRIIMNLSEPQDDPARFSPVAFDFERLILANDVTEVKNLDETGVH